MVPSDSTAAGPRQLAAPPACWTRGRLDGTRRRTMVDGRIRSGRTCVIVALVLLASAAATVLAQQPVSTRAAEERDMRLVGHDDLQARSAYQPVIQKQGARWIAYIGHHGGQRPNPLTGKVEWSGTSVV